MTDAYINYWAVIVSAVAQMVIGSLWYGPLFGKMWMAEMNYTSEKMASMKQKGMGMLYAAQAVGSLVTAYVLAHFVDYLAVTTIGGALQLALWIWLGFFVTTALGLVLWEGRSKTFFYVNVAYHLISLAVVASILAVWR
jgi:Protein of unknown function (DUF1761)